MSRWTTVKALESYEISIYEQALFMAKGLPVYNNDGMRVIEYNSGEDMLYGHAYLSSDSGSYGESDTTYYRWLDAPRELRALRFKTTELAAFLLSQQDRPGIKKIIDMLPTSLFGSDVVDYKEKFLSSQREISELTSEIEELKNKIKEYSQNKPHSKTDRAIQSRQDKAITDWALTVEKAVSLAVTCTRNGKPKSIAQHKNMWRSLWAADNDNIPRSAGFEAFRRGLPDDLKGTS